MTKQYWADASTQNCVWLFQTSQKVYPNGCECDIYDDEGQLFEGMEEKEKDCNCFHIKWNTEEVYLTNKEANNRGHSRPYAYGKKGEGWRVYGVPAKGIMVDLLGQHNKEFEEDVEYITDYSEDIKSEAVGKSGYRPIEIRFETLINAHCEAPFEWYKDLGLDKSDASKIRRGLVIPPKWLRIKIAQYFKTDSTTIWTLEDLPHLRKILKKQKGRREERC